MSAQSAEKMQQSLAEKILPMIDAVIADRKHHWDQMGEKAGERLNERTLASFVTGYANGCGAIAVGCNLVPGPVGMLAAVPEILLIMREQLKMVCDVGYVFGHHNPSRELLLGILLSGTGTGTGGLIVVHGGRAVVKRASMRMLQRLVALLGARVTQRVLKSILAKWIPLVGAGALGLWARHSTKQLGQRAQEICRCQIVFEDAEPEEDVAVESTSDTSLERFKLLVALMAVDRNLDEREQLFLKPLLEDLEVPPPLQDAMKLALHTGKVEPIDYTAIARHPEDRIAVLMDMIALADADGRRHPAELLFIREAAARLGVPPEDLESLMTAEKA